jgi:hypothetical protein
MTRRSGRPRTPVADRFWSKVDVRGPDDCWLWTGASDVRGYGRFMVNGRNTAAPRVALALDGRPLATNLHYACHTCDVKACVNPRHLYVGNAATNARDAIDRGLAYGWPRVNGDAHPGARLTSTKVAEIRSRFAAGDVNQRTLAAEYGVSKATISRVVRGRLWSHV